MDEIVDKIVKQHLLPVILGVAGLIFFGYGLISLQTKSFGKAQDKPDILFEAASDKAPLRQGSEGQADKQIAVDVEGAVIKPGVYKIAADSRVQDALIAAGGMNQNADREKVSKSLNLAGKLTDGGKIYIPSVGEEALVAGASTSESTTVNINSASDSELEALPGIGQVTAGKIIDNRPYASIQDLVDKKVLSKGVFEKIKDKIGI